ncbi:Xylulose kinase [Vitis vinifera]|uniref:Xylulose kinase n=1 Tax=Vitis vinifera TaxID=29760 RepID=A0A438F8E1_VITVI|nr:Xylulose kinase [Vitis vinifera]
MVKRGVGGGLRSLWVFWSGLWKEIMKEANWCWESIEFKVGKGTRVLFWTDKWCGNEVLSQTFPQLFTLAGHRNAKVSEVWDSSMGQGGWNLSLARDFNDWELDQIGDMLNLLRDFRTSPERIQRIWMDKVPTKVSFFAWEASWGKILTLDKLQRRGWQLPNWCFLCGCEEENANHILLHCTVVKTLWEIALAIFGVQWVFPEFHFNKNCLIVQWSGDNPNSLAGLTLNTPGDLAISLGTSDTVFGITSNPQPSLEGHVFPNPVDTEGYMVMLCYKNGSLTREDVRNRCAKESWEVFNEFLEKTPPLNGGKIGFYYKDHEILPPLPGWFFGFVLNYFEMVVHSIPRNCQMDQWRIQMLSCLCIAVGFHRYVLQGFTGENLDGINECEVEEFDPSSEVRAVIEGQFLSMRGHAERFGMPSPPKRIIATGGASANHSILKSIASIFGCDVYTVQRPDSASLGAALRAAHGWLCNTRGKFVPTSCLYKDKLEKTSLSCKLAVTAETNHWSPSMAC